MPGDNFPVLPQVDEAQELFHPSESNVMHYLSSAKLIPNRHSHSASNLRPNKALSRDNYSKNPLSKPQNQGFSLMDINSQLDQQYQMQKTLSRFPQMRSTMTETDSWLKTGYGVSNNFMSSGPFLTKPLGGSSSTKIIRESDKFVNPQKRRKQDLEARYTQTSGQDLLNSLAHFRIDLSAEDQELLHKKKVMLKPIKNSAARAGEWIGPDGRKFFKQTQNPKEIIKHSEKLESVNREFFNLKYNRYVAAQKEKKDLIERGYKKEKKNTFILANIKESKGDKKISTMEKAQKHRDPERTDNTVQVVPVFKQRVGIKPSALQATVPPDYELYDSNDEEEEGIYYGEKYEEDEEELGSSKAARCAASIKKSFREKNFGGDAVQGARLKRFQIMKLKQIYPLQDMAYRQRIMQNMGQGGIAGTNKLAYLHKMKNEAFEAQLQLEKEKIVAQKQLADQVFKELTNKYVAF